MFLERRNKNERRKESREDRELSEMTFAQYGTCVVKTFCKLGANTVGKNKSACMTRDHPEVNRNDRSGWVISGSSGLLRQGKLNHLGGVRVEGHGVIYFS
jgi:hypothetical protein